MARRPQFRSARSFQRRRAYREPRACILIVCEGEKTEPTYFEALRRELRLTPVEVEVSGEECGSAPTSVVDYALKRKQERPQEVRRGEAHADFDEIWCVMDVERISQNPNLLNALQKARDNQLAATLSNPCFEYWFLLHFEDTSKGFEDCTSLLRYIKKNYLPEYEKGANISDCLGPRRGVALERGERHAHLRGEEPVLKRNSSTDVHKLARRLLDMTRDQ
ncbi:MAG: RloB domain-containing protein [Armatimonadetes bacterium]|nr:RloB domain-containing protein [Armatimonadota bacterium]